MKRRTSLIPCVALVASCVGFALAGCGQAPASASGQDSTAASSQAQTSASGQDSTSASSQAPAADASLADGTYAIEAETDSSMFRSEKCTLTVKDGVYTVTLSLPGEGFSRLYYGTAEEAAAEGAAPIYDYYLNDEGLYTFDLPVEKLEEELPIAAYGQRRDTWYDHTIIFHAPAAS